MKMTFARVGGSTLEIRVDFGTLASFTIRLGPEAIKKLHYVLEELFPNETGIFDEKIEIKVEEGKEDVRNQEG